MCAEEMKREVKMAKRGTDFLARGNDKGTILRNWRLF